MAEYLMYRDAARLVRRSVRTIKRWRRGGMSMSFDAEGRRVVELAALLAWWRARLTAAPCTSSASAGSFRARVSAAKRWIIVQVSHPRETK